MLECFVWLSVEQRRKKPFLLHIKGWCMKGWCTTLVVSWQDFSTHLLLPSIQPAVFHCALSPNCPVPPVTLNHVVLPIAKKGDVWGSPLTSPWKYSLQSTRSRLLHFNRINAQAASLVDFFRDLHSSWSLALALLQALCSEGVTVHKGEPQGSKLRPALFTSVTWI